MTPLLHVSMIGFVVLLIAILSVAGIRLGRTGHVQAFSKGFGISLLAIWVCYNIYYFLPANFRFDTSLPLHVCDFLAIIASLCLIRPNRKTSALLYFCALALTTQAILTPTGDQDPASVRFWLFWVLHGGILAASVFDLVVRRYRPVFTDLLFVLVCDLIYVVVILPPDIIFGWNYGFIGNVKPDTPTLVDALGPWPLRVVWMVLLVVAVQFMMYLPWKRWGKRRGRG